jgi:serralysin
VDSFAPGNYGWTTLIHEIGHTLGLKHPGDYKASGGGGTAPFLDTSVDTRKLSIMSYIDPPNLSFLFNNGKPSFKNIYDTSLMTYDIAALEFMYGKKYGELTTDQAGNLNKVQTLNFTPNYRGFQTIWAPNGALIDASQTTSSNIFDLRGGAYSSIGLSERDAFVQDLVTGKYKSEQAAAGYVDDLIKAQSTAVISKLYTSLNNTGLASGSKFSEIIGGSGNDKFFASDYSSFLDGGAGTNDTVYLTGASTDWSYEDGTTLEGSSLTEGTVVLRNNNTAQVLTLENIESFAFFDSKSSLTHT